MSPEVLSSQFAMEKSRLAERERLFLVYANKWWQEYLAIRPVHVGRMVKIFVPDENGSNRMVSTLGTINMLGCWMKNIS